MATLIPSANRDAQAWEDFESVTLQWVGLQSTYTPNKAHDTISDIVGSELSGGTYARSDPTSSASRTVNADETYYDCDPPSMGTAGQDCGSFALCTDTGNDSVDLVLAIFDTSTQPSGQPLTPTLSSGHLVTLT